MWRDGTVEFIAMRIYQVSINHDTYRKKTQVKLYVDHLSMFNDHIAVEVNLKEFLANFVIIGN